MSTQPSAQASGPSPQVLAVVQGAITAFDATAGGPIGAQQSAIAGLLADGQQNAQRKCPAATGTIDFEPVYARLAPAPDWQSATGPLAGTIYALPTLIRIYTGDRITGTDLTDLHLAVDNGRVRLPALCVG